ASLISSGTAGSPAACTCVSPARARQESATALPRNLSENDIMPPGELSMRSTRRRTHVTDSRAELRRWGLCRLGRSLWTASMSRTVIKPLAHANKCQYSSRPYAIDMAGHALQTSRNVSRGNAQWFDDGSGRIPAHLATQCQPLDRTT